MTAPDSRPLCSLLPWDTEFFGHRIGNVNRSALTPDEARAARAWAEAEGVECLYLLARESDGTSLAAAASVGFTFVDLRVELATDLPATFTPEPTPAVRAARPDDLPALQRIARTAHRDSRFFLDAHFPVDRAEELYARWIARDFAEHHVLVAEAAGEPVGYLSIQRQPSHGVISLLAVDAAHGGRGLGRALVQASLAWFHAQGLRRVQVVTQGQNIRAQRLYQSAGFRTLSAEPRLHLWLPKRPVITGTEPLPFNRSSFAGREMDHISQTLACGQIAGDQTFSKKCQRLLEESLGVPRALVTTSCTHALEMAALLLDLQPGDEVILPSFTFVSTANAFVLRGAKPVFCDVRPDTLNLDERKLPALITPRTRAIVPVHYAGVGCEMDAINALAARHGIAVVEDNAHGLFGKYRGRWLGTFGAFATQSFHETKNITCGEGGALLVNDARFAERAEIIREKGTNRARFFRGQVDKYSWVDLGSSYVMSDVLAAFLYGQLECWTSIQDRRRVLWHTYDAALRDWAARLGATQPSYPAHCEPAWHMYQLLLPSLAVRTALIAHLKARGIHAVFHYLPLHLSEYAQRWGGRPGDCPVTEDVSDRLLRLPFFNSMTPAQQARVIDALHAFEPSRG